ncbi:MAG: DUF2752 domain-containing protein [Planctomycetes bacterium]|nr:DUF2752 domain-containing protein [Planctomycetota bacterium]
MAAGGTTGPARLRLRGAVAATICGGILAASALLPRGGLGVPTCFFRVVTTVPCPSCGMTRAFCALAHGDVAAAAQFNLAAPLVYVATAAIFVLGVVQTVCGADALGVAWSRTRRVLVPLTIAAMATAWATKFAAHVAA